MGRRLHGFARTAVAAGISAVLFVAVIAMGTTGAQADSSATATWVDGEATAIAQALAVAPTTAGLGYNSVLGTSIADYQLSEGQAESQTFNGGAIVLAATSTQCDGSPPVIAGSQLPQPAIAETANGNNTQSQSINQQYGHGNFPAGAIGSEVASVTTQPTADAVTKVADIDIPGALEVSGVQSSASVADVVGQLRKAVSTADIGEIKLAGLVDLKGLHFEATQETGPGGKIVQQAATWSVATAAINGQPQSVAADALGTLFGAINTALEGTGFHVSLPQVTTLDNGQVNLTPLSIGIDGSALGQQLVGPVLGALQPVRDTIDNILLKQISCKLGTPLTVADIGLGVLSGGGNLDLQVGQLSAQSDGTTYANPFGNCLLDCGGTTSLNDNLPSSLGDTGALSIPSVGGGNLPSSGPGSATKYASGPISRTVHCVTTSLAGHPGCSNGAALPVGLIGLGSVAALFAADYVRLRRYRRIIPEEVLE
ncbi:MAG TPA: hypothetical protein VE991_11385 [Acidimicrobiales bacterium]|nr:hypothetical protein [Acidimicrobiales bacterium]